MRQMAWWLAVLLVACGKSEHDARSEHPKGGAGGVAASGAPSSPSAGSNEPTTAGGAEPLAGGGGGGGGVAAGGSGPDPSLGGFSDTSEAGSPASAGAPSYECDGDYTACGCGCCGGASETTKSACYYPERGESLDAIKQRDRELSMSASCANAGCELGTRYVCCSPTTEPTDPGAYETSGGHIQDEIYRVSLYRTGADERCQSVHFGRGDGPGSITFPISLPTGWIIESADDYACQDKNSADASKRRWAIGGAGSLSFVQAGGMCTAVYDFRLFFAEGDSVQEVRFASEGAPAPDLPECQP